MDQVSFYDAVGGAETAGRLVGQIVG